MDLSIIIPIVTALVTLIGSVLLWFLNERNKRRQEMYFRKEERYIILVNSLKGFYSSSSDKSLKDDFIKQLNLSWLYCSDKVILKAYQFIKMIHTERERDYTHVEKEQAVGEFVLAIREDLLSRKILNKTRLKPGDFMHIHGT